MTKVEGYLINLGLTFEEIAENAWVIHDPEKGLEQVAVVAEAPLLIIRVKVMEVPAKKREAFFQTLLNLNGSDLVHGAYAVQGDDVVIIDTLQLETLDFEEFQASLDAIGLALTQHYSTLSKYR